jgi:hypothetical protein
MYSASSIFLLRTKASGMVLNNDYKLICESTEESTLGKQQDSKIYDQTLIMQFFPKAIS